MLKLNRVLMALVLFGYLSSIVACSKTSAETGKTGSSGVSQLFVQTTNSGTWELVDDGQHTLTLMAPGAHVTAFTDRPERLASQMTTEEFLDRWASFGFDVDPPNAAVVVNDATSTESTVVVELSNPQMVGTFIQYTATVLHSPGGTFAQYKVDDDLPATFKDASLFIDNASPNVFQSITIDVSNVEPGQKVGIELSSSGPDVAWSLGSSFKANAGLAITSQSGVLPITLFSVKSSEIQIETASGSDENSLTFSLELYLVGGADIDMFYLQSYSDPGIEITAQIGDSLPQTVSSSLTPFNW